MSLPEGGGGAFALPSPTHAHQMDMTSAVRSLRRSISRSPSRFLSRTNSRHSDSSTPASPQSPCRRFRLTPQRQHDHLTHSNLAQSAPPTQAGNASQSQPQTFTPLRQSVKLSLRSVKSARTLSPSRQIARARASPKSPLRRALNASSDQALSTSAAAQHSQALLRTMTEPLTELQTNTPQAPPRPQRSSSNKASRHSLHLDVSGSSENAFLKALDSDSDPAILATGGLKRNDAMMNLDQPYQGSPVPKRRSMYGASGYDQINGERGIFGAISAPSTGFKIHEDAGAERDTIYADGSGAQAAPPTPAMAPPKRSSSMRKSTVMPRAGDKSSSWGRRTGQRHLAQLDQEGAPTPAKPRATVAFNQFEPPSTGAGLFSSPAAPNPFQFEPKSMQNHHPLAQTQTLSASSSANSFTEEDSSNQAPAPPAPARWGGAHPFSRSLPVGAERPGAGPGATPKQGGLLYQGAFGSTGLISKVNRNPEHFDKKLVPPDTPCKPWKRQTDRFNTYPTSGTPGSVIKSRGNNRNSFAGISSLTFQPPEHTDTPSSSIFAPKPSGNRRLAGDDGEGDAHVLVDSGDDRGGNIPPTPTKSGMTPSLSNLSELSEHCSDQSFDSPSANRKSFGPRGGLPLSAVRPAPMRQPNFGSSSSIAQRRASPRTPQDISLPETTSQLSISRPIGAGGLGDHGRLPPATPTTDRDFRSSTGVFSTPVHDEVSFFGTDVQAEPSLQRRFDEVTKLGDDGEFSIVYRVKETRRYDFQPVENRLFGGETRQTPLDGGVFVVKKSKQPYLGPRDREKKLREARILAALRDSEHVVQYIADWETDDHLYIQTEYCENGSLKDFYTREGFFGRLDDFCIFKILLDLTLGLKEIHDSGFMHLDIKPANIFVTFEGALKIGDFGLARAQSEAGSLDMEGDREYMAPEMLHGRFGPSSDIFSLGIMIFEAIANVEIPGNGEDWHKLRSGDFSGVPSLAWTASCETNPQRSGLYSDDLETDRTHDARDLFGSHKRSELLEPPSFMEDPLHPESLRSMVSWMMSNSSDERPTADQLLSLGSLQWIAQRRQAPATIFEGRWGPVESELPAVVDVDTEMTGV